MVTVDSKPLVWPIAVAIIKVRKLSPIRFWQVSKSPPAYLSNKNGETAYRKLLAFLTEKFRPVLQVIPENRIFLNYVSW